MKSVILNTEFEAFINGIFVTIKRERKENFHGRNSCIGWEYWQWENNTR